MNTSVTPGLVSVIVASYNHAEYLPKRMESLIAQTYPHIEIIVIDDCSTDNSLDVLRTYASHPRVRLIPRERNGGWVAVSNQGVELSQGEFVIFANCDDDCETNMIERLVAGMENPSVGISFCRSLFIDSKDRVVGTDFDTREPSFRARCINDTILSKAEMTRFLLYACVIPNLSAALFRKECFEKVGFLSPNFVACSDWDLFFRVAADYDVAYCAQPLNRFRQHKTTIRSVTKDRVTYEEFFRLLLGNLRVVELSAYERCRFRMRAMSLWAVHLVSPSLGGLKNFPYHFGRVIALDTRALPFLLPSVFVRLIVVISKALGIQKRISYT